MPKQRTRHVGGKIRVRLKEGIDPLRPILDAVIVQIKEDPQGRYINRVRIESEHPIWHNQELDGRKWNVANEPAITQTTETTPTAGTARQS